MKPHTKQLTKLTGRDVPRHLKVSEMTKNCWKNKSGGNENNVFVDFNPLKIMIDVTPG